MFAYLFSKISVFKILSLSFSLIMLVFLFFLLLNKEFNQKSLAAGPVLAVNPKSLDFGDVYRNKVSRLRILICNFGNADLNIISITIAAPFVVENFNNTVAPTVDQVNSDKCDSLDNHLELIVHFEPGGVGKFSQILKIETNGGNQDIYLQGRCIEWNQTQRAKTWLEAQYGDVYAIGDINANYVATDTTVDYRIISGSLIDSWVSDKGATYQDIAFISSFPDSDNNFTVSVGSVDIEGLITNLGGFNMYGYTVDDAFAPSGYLGSDLTDPTEPLKPLGLNYKVCSGDLVIGDNVFSNGAGGVGSELIAVKGNIYIIGDTYYSAKRPTKIEDLASLGFMALKRDSVDLSNLEQECQPDPAIGCKTASNPAECFDSNVNKVGGNIYLVDVHNLITTSSANKYIIGVDYNIFSLTVGNIEANKNYCAETGEHPGKKVFDLDGTGFIDSNKEIYLGWDDYFGNPAGVQNPYDIDVIYDYCQKSTVLDPNPPFLPITVYNINNVLSPPNPKIMTVAPIHIVGTYYAEGAFHSGKAKLPLIVEGLVMAQSFHLEREAIVDNPQNYIIGGGTLSPSEVFIYDGRAILNPPPGFRELINERFNFSLVKP